MNRQQQNAVGRLAKVFHCFSLSEDDTDYTAAQGVVNNTVQEQIENTYDNERNSDYEK